MTLTVHILLNRFLNTICYITRAVFILYIHFRKLYLTNVHYFDDDVTVLFYYSIMNGNCIHLYCSMF